MLKTQTLDYQDNGTALEAIYAYEDTTEKKPLVLIAHDWSGKNAWMEEKAKQIASLGYIGFALDMYGKGIVGTTTEEKSALMQPLASDRAMLQRRMQAALNAAKNLPMVDANRIGAIGFCFGGLCALDLARTGADIKGVVSFHGLLHAPDNELTNPIKAEILVLHGYKDPMGTMDAVVAFGKEMTERHANWELDMYGNAVHAFANPKANDMTLGTVYNKDADERSWVAMKQFFARLFV